MDAGEGPISEYRQCNGKARRDQCMDACTPVRRYPSLGPRIAMRPSSPLPPPPSRTFLRIAGYRLIYQTRGTSRREAKVSSGAIQIQIPIIIATGTAITSASIVSRRDTRFAGCWVMDWASATRVLCPKGFGRNLVKSLGIDVSPVVTELSPTHRVLDVAMAQVGLQGPRIVPLPWAYFFDPIVARQSCRSPKGRITHGPAGRRREACGTLDQLARN